VFAILATMSLAGLGLLQSLLAIYFFLFCLTFLLLCAALICIYRIEEFTALGKLILHVGLINAEEERKKFFFVFVDLSYNRHDNKQRNKKTSGSNK
jgi:hypothetical protein